MSFPPLSLPLAVLVRFAGPPDANCARPALFGTWGISNVKCSIHCLRKGSILFDHGERLKQPTKRAWMYAFAVSPSLTIPAAVSKGPCYELYPASSSRRWHVMRFKMNWLLVFALGKGSCLRLHHDLQSQRLCKDASQKVTGCRCGMLSGESLFEMPGVTIKGRDSASYAFKLEVGQFESRQHSLLSVLMRALL